MHGSRVSCLSLLSCLANTSSSTTHLATTQYHISISEYLSLDVLCLIYVYHAYIPTYILSPARVDDTAAIPSVPPSFEFAYVGDYSNHGCKCAVCSDHSSRGVKHDVAVLSCAPLYLHSRPQLGHDALLGAAAEPVFLRAGPPDFYNTIYVSEEPPERTARTRAGRRSDSARSAPLS
ncbi:hypothetical protein C2E23DRAFT_550219 [Lenzites betulinus]|nr:hypothetical protein C2E23DRAFT_550219 [Lenzites betulinus]